ncbi:hypothetical protein T265_03750 [Opisthorchis viverrini]|uniref:Uncharacterized protein n=1 Tax=Opisthorchis viverrini TaxID=6198 RepID=A0A074ZRA7_OPIVI|nr:hypothetical protein T265_03750 [Opisthorchis viverrini]KER29636.1 hypothetical protein T265_03750 [Opisthorchis viverrini]
MLWNVGSSGALFGCWSVHRAWQLGCKRFITNRGDTVSAGLSGSPTPNNQTVQGLLRPTTSFTLFEDHQVSTNPEFPSTSRFTWTKIGHISTNTLICILFWFSRGDSTESLACDILQREEVRWISGNTLALQEDDCGMRRDHLRYSICSRRHFCSKRLRVYMYRDISNILVTETLGGLVQHIQLPENITNERFSWVSVATIFEISQYMYIFLMYIQLPENITNERFSRVPGHKLVLAFAVPHAFLSTPGMWRLEDPTGVHY